MLGLVRVKFAKTNFACDEKTDFLQIQWMCYRSLIAKSSGIHLSNFWTFRIRIGS
jgi:hypothetical protein